MSRRVSALYRQRLSLRFHGMAGTSLVLAPSRAVSCSCPAFLSGQKTDPIGQEFGRRSARACPVHTDGGRQTGVEIQAAWSLHCPGNLYSSTADFTLPDHDKCACLKTKPKSRTNKRCLYFPSGLYIITNLTTSSFQPQTRWLRTRSSAASSGRAVPKWKGPGGIL